MSDERKPLPETGFRCYKAEPDGITSNMTILIDQMISWLEAERASGENIKKDGRGQDVIKLTQLPTVNPDTNLSHCFVFDDFKPDASKKKGGGYQQQAKPAPMPPTDSDIPF